MRRKVIQIANSTQLISLPRKWAVRNNVRKGDELEVKEQKGELVVSLTNEKLKPKSLELNIPTPDKFLRRLLFSPYIQGYTEIKINYSNSKVFELVSNEVELLVGYEIITQGSNYCLIKSVATALDNDFDNIVKRIFTSTHTTLSEFLDLIKKADFQGLQNLTSTELTNNKLSYLCLRLLNINGYSDPNKTSSLYYSIIAIEEINDLIRDACEYLSENKPKLNKAIHVIIQDTIQQFTFVRDLFYKFDDSSLYILKKQSKKLQAEMLAAMKKLSNSDQIILCFLHDIKGKIDHISKEIHY